MTKSTPILFGKTDEMIFQILAQSAIRLSTNDVYQRMVSLGTFTDIPAIKARTDIAAKLRALKKRGVISWSDEKTGRQLWEIDPDVRAKLPKAKRIPAVVNHDKQPAEPVKAKVRIKTKPATILPATIRVDIPADQAKAWADVLNDLTYCEYLKPNLADMFGALEASIRQGLAQEAA